MHVIEVLCTIVGVLIPFLVKLYRLFATYGHTKAAELILKRTMMICEKYAIKKGDTVQDELINDVLTLAAEYKYSLTKNQALDYVAMAVVNNEKI